MHLTERHYTRGGLEEAILDGLARAGKNLDDLAPDDLAPVDEFHVRGRLATGELAREIGLDRGMRLLDVGCGLGGPSRRLAAEYGCHVTGLDCTEEYCRVAAALSDRLGLRDLTEYRCGDALAMPFADASFDVVWTQHVSMNIRDKPRLYEEMKRVLKPGGRLALYDILAGPGGDIHFPVPWARDRSLSFLVSPDELQRLLEQAGFEIVSRHDRTAAGRDSFVAMAERTRRQGLAPLGLHLLFGADFPEMARNQVRNLNEDRIVLMQVVARR